MQVCNFHTVFLPSKKNVYETARLTIFVKKRKKNSVPGKPSMHINWSVGGFLVSTTSTCLMCRELQCTLDTFHLFPEEAYLIFKKC